MENTALIAISRMNTLRRQMTSIANNVANMNTPAYKAEKMMFTEHLVKSQNNESFAPSRLSFVRDLASYRDLSDGAMESTGNPLDLALSGPGYFTIDTPDGERYTRSGHFSMDAGGQMITTDGRPVLTDAGQPIFFSPEDKDISIARDGTVSTENGTLGKLAVVTFENEQNLVQVGSGLYRSDVSPTPVDQPSLEQGFIEGSNINAVTEMTRMITVNRAYESVKNFVERENTRQKSVLDLIKPTI